ncbi:MAG: hypothetical protein BWY82_00488 [Verrucomicrobia bacterium ADurb.Bin474]|nr:MAG: hypothetical protein BWY82_00488 [Verrucomicrobia bacterium ADurb.Bin474]
MIGNSLPIVGSLSLVAHSGELRSSATRKPFKVAIEVRAGRISGNRCG